MKQYFYWYVWCFSISAGCASTNYITEDYLQRTYTNEHSQFAQVAGMDVHYRDEGSGLPILLVHGISSSLHTWDGWTEQLKSDYRVVRLDLPGFGLTGAHPENEYSIDRYITVIDALARHLNLETFYLVGNSLGGWIAWEYTYKFPQKVSKLILIDAAGFVTPDDPPKPIRMAQKPIFKKIATKSAPKCLVRKYVKQAYGDRKKVSKELVNRYFELSNAPGNPLAFYTIANSQYQSNTENLTEIEVPTLIMWGQEDKKWIDVSHAYLFKEALPNNQLIIYPGVGHLPMEEVPLKSVRDAREFLAQ